MAMCEMTIDNRNNLLPWLLLISLLFAVLYVLSEHAVERHGTEAEIVQACIEKNGAIQEWLQPNGRLARVCQLDDGKFGIEIVDEEGNNITAFIKNRMRTLEQVEQYLANKGAQLIWTR